MEVYVYLYVNGEPLSVKDLSGPEIHAIAESLGKYGNLDVFTNEDYAVMEDFNEAEFNKAEKKFNEPFVITPRQLGLNRWGEVEVLFLISPLPEIKIPEKQRDIITDDPILDGTRMVDFHGERARHRYYKESTYNSFQKQENPFDRKDILPGDLTRYTAKLDSTMPVQQAGRRKTRKSKRRARKTRRRHK
jgi:hypothetical protein